MPPPRKSILYRDTWAAPGSQLHAAITEGNEKLAAQIYRQCEEAAMNQKKPKTVVHVHAPLNEPRIADNERIYKGYTYIVHGRYNGLTYESYYVSVKTERVSEFKIRCPKVVAVHKCDMAGRGLPVKKVTK